MLKTRMRRLVAPLLAAGLLTLPALSQADVFLQYFEGRWETIERRMPDIFAAGYSGVWVPPPGVADSGGFSVGYDVFDRFNLGTPNWRTLYGTTQGFSRMSQEMGRAGVGLYIDAVLNHNGFRDHTTPGFEENGGYPGFVTRVPWDIHGDFHDPFRGGDLEGRLAGLIDIAQTKDYRFVRHPVPGMENNIPNEFPRDSNRQFYPDWDLPADEMGRHPFNLANPMAGKPFEENSTGLLMRYLQWMVQVHGVTGFRLDATKHMPTWFFNDFYDARLFNLGRDPITGGAFTPFSFGEAFTGDFGQLAAYVRKDGFGNRDTLDFPLYFAMAGVFNAGGLASMRSLEFASFDGVDGNPNSGTFGVMFAGSHDEEYAGRPAGLDNVAIAHILTRTGLPIVYYNAREFGDGRDFPKDGRGDALGNFGNVITTLTRINQTHIKGAHITRWIDDDVYIYERNQSAIIGITDRRDGGFSERGIQTSFAPGTVLVELTGHARASFIDPFDDIPDTITVGSDGRVSFRIPNNTRPGSTLEGGGFHGLGYVIYGPRVPDSTLEIVNSTTTIGPDPADKRPESTRRLTPLYVVNGDTIDVRLTVPIDAGAPNDNALIKVNFGQVDVNGDGGVITGGEFRGFDEFQQVEVTPTERVYRASINATGLNEGYTYIETVAFLQRPAGTTPLYDVQRKVVYLDRVAPGVDLVFPSRTGDSDITSRDYEAVVSADHTVDSMHILRNVPPGATDSQILDLLNESNRARRHNRLEFRRALSDLPNGPLELTIVAFEETGTYTIRRFGNIGVDVPLPTLVLGIDTNTDPCCVDFAPVPSFVNSAAMPEEIVIRVQTQNIDGAGRNISFPADYSVSIQIDGGAPIDAVPFNQSLLPPVNRLVQNDQNLGDQFDEFRLLWRGYSTGSHTIRASARLLADGTPANEAIAEVFISESLTGPTITLTSPAPDGSTILSNPDTVTIAGIIDSDAPFLQAFINHGERDVLVGQLSNLPSGEFSLTRATGSYARTDVIAPGSLEIMGGTFPVRVIASTGPNGTGIVSQVGTTVTIEGVPTLPTLPALRVDGDATDILLAAPVLATSQANGPVEGGSIADFGADGTLTELRAVIRGETLYIAVRGDMFGAGNNNFANGSFLLVDVNAGSGQGATNIAQQLTDESDGLRRDISAIGFRLSDQLISSGHGIDLVVGISEPGVAYGYTMGSDGLPGSFGGFEFQPNIVASFSPNVSAVPAAPGTVYPAPNAFEIAIPLAVMGNPDPRNIRLAAVTASSADNNGFPSPNTLPENSSNEFTPVQIIESMAALPVSSSGVVINEISVDGVDRVELYNPSGATVDLSGWTLRFYDSADVRADWTVPAGVSIGAGVYLVIGEKTADAAPSSPSDVYTGFNITWDPSRGGALALLDRSGSGRDYVSWLNQDGAGSTVAGVVPPGTTFTGTVNAPAANSNHTLARDAQSTDTNAAGDWDNTSGINSDGPTFGSANTGGMRGGPNMWMMF